MLAISVIYLRNDSMLIVAIRFKSILISSMEYGQYRRFPLTGGFLLERDLALSANQNKPLKQSARV